MTEIPNEITDEYLDELSERLTTQQIFRLQQKHEDVDQEKMQKKIKDQVPDKTDIFSQVSDYQYVEQELEVSEGFTARFRTIHEKASDEAISYALENCDNNQDLFARLKQRRRLAYGLFEINGRRVAPADFDQVSYRDLELGGSGDDENKSIEERLKDKADETMQEIELLPRIMTDRLKTAYSIWEFLVFDKMGDIDDPAEQAKN